MSEHEKETEFLKECLRHDESPACQELELVSNRIQHDQRCVRRATWLMVVVTAFAGAALLRPAWMLEHLPTKAGAVIANLLCALGGGSTISLLLFVALGMFYRRKLNARREECRRNVTRLLGVRTRLVGGAGFGAGSGAVL